jgi:acetoin utilization deacetylase AcuC-like enzyme
MTRTAVIFSPIYYQHNTGRGHPESAKRLRTIINELHASKLSQNKEIQFLEPEKATIENVELVHDMEYVRHIESFCKFGGGLLDAGDTVASPETYKVALNAVGGTLKALDLVMRRKFQNAFALVRPPGHHAGKFTACGFCIFNNIAVAAQYLLKKHKLERVLILDVDAHHGNGTQEAFYGTNKILYISLHEDPRGFPGTGFIDELGEGEGLGYNVNIPLPFKTGDKIYLRVVREIVAPIINQYKPQFMLVSAGFDGHRTDPVGCLNLSAQCYQEIYETVLRLAVENCNGKLLSVLEGGYSIGFVGKMATAAISVMSGSSYALKDSASTPKERILKQGERILKEVKKAQKASWNID